MNQTSFFCAGAIWFYFQCGLHSNLRIVYELNIFIATKHIFVHLFNENICQNFNKGSVIVETRCGGSVELHH